MTLPPIFYLWLSHFELGHGGMGFWVPGWFQEHQLFCSLDYNQNFT